LNSYPKRGELYYIFKASVGSEIDAEDGRPGIIVSNDRNNRHSSCVEVVFLTTRDKAPMPTHVEINATGRRSTALCEQIHTVSVDRIGSFCGRCTDDEMEAVDEALLASLGISEAEYDDTMDFAEFEALHQRDIATIADMKARYDEAVADAYLLKSELEIYKQLYDNLLDRLTRNLS